MDFIQKLNYLMNRYNLNKHTLSQNSDIPYTTIDGWYKKGYDGLKLTTLRKLSEYFNTTLDYWVLDQVNDPNYGKSCGFVVEYDEMEHIKKYRVLDEHGKEAVDGLLDTEYKRYQKIQETITISSSVPTMKGNTAPLQEQKIIYLPEPLQSASAGTGQIADDDTSEQVAVYYNEITSKADFIMRISGDSMEPKFMDGDHVLVRSQPAVEIGEIGIFIRDSERFIKIYRGSYLESINPKYGDVSLEEYSYCLGKVLGILKPEWIAE